MNATRKIIEFAAADHALPDQVKATALYLLSDTLAGGAAGAASGEAQRPVAHAIGRLVQRLRDPLPGMGRGTRTRGGPCDVGGYRCLARFGRQDGRL